MDWMMPTWAEHVATATDGTKLYTWKNAAGGRATSGQRCYALALLNGQHRRWDAASSGAQRPKAPPCGGRWSWVRATAEG